MSQNTQTSMKKGKIIVISASSGAGKTTLTNALHDYFKDKIHLNKVITYTTRAARAGEVDGIDYYFITQDLFKQKIKEQFFLEWSGAYGAYYGSPRSILQSCKNGHSFLIVLDRVGVQKLLAICPEALVTVWITVDLIKLGERLQKRGSDTVEARNARLELAKKEKELEDRERIFRYHVKNDDFPQAFNDLIKIIMQELEIIE